MCDWTNRPSNSYDWQLNKGATLSSNTGPANDHTSGQGKEEGTRFQQHHFQMFYLATTDFFPG